MVVITGQVTRGVIGTDSFQESDIVGITMPVVSCQLPAAVHRRRPAPHEGSLHRLHRPPWPRAHRHPGDLSGAEMVFHYPDSVNLPSYKPTYRGNARQVKQAAELIEKAERP